MKKFFLAACFLLASVAGFAQKLTADQEKAQRTVYFYLEDNGYNPTVDESDNSVCFRKDGVFYWITFTGETPLLYTINRKGFALNDENPDLFIPRIATKAANEVNKNYNGVRIVLGEKKATVKAEAYCKTGEDFTEIFPRLYGQFDKIAREFKKVYKKEFEINQALEEKKAEEAYKERPASELVGQVKEVKFRLCDKDKNPTTTFGAPLKSAGTGYIQASFTLAPRKAADKSYDFELRIVSEATVTDPTGVYGDTKPARKMKIVNTIELKKSKKEATYIFDPAGGEDNGYWRSGRFNYQIIEAGSVIYEGSFNIE